MLVSTCGSRVRLAVATALTISQAGSALAHGFAGSRFFPATITIDDPFVADELSLPTVSNQKTGTDPSVVETAISGELSKRITSDFGFSIGYAWNHLDQAGPPHNPNGFQNLEITPRYQFLLNAPHEAVASVGVITEVGGTGARQVGAVPFATYTPQLYFGKGAGGHCQVEASGRNTGARTVVMPRWLRCAIAPPPLIGRSEASTGRRDGAGG